LKYSMARSAASAAIFFAALSRVSMGSVMESSCQK
jgi:hypothetical protein